MHGEFFGDLLRSVAGNQDIDASAKEFAGKVLAGRSLGVNTIGDCLCKLKNKIGGVFWIESKDTDKIVLKGCRCPFGNSKGSPELCRVTQVVFSEMAQSCCEGATVEIKKSIARGDSQCLIEVHLPS